MLGVTLGRGQRESNRTATAPDASRSEKKQRCDDQAAPQAGIEQRLAYVQVCPRMHSMLITRVCIRPGGLAEAGLHPVGQIGSVERDLLDNTNSDRW